MVNLIFYKGKNPKKKNLIKNQSCSVNILKIKITMQKTHIISPLIIIDRILKLLDYLMTCRKKIQFKII